MTASPVQPASAAMPSEEIERVFNLAARAMQRRFKASGSEEEIEAALSEFFAPILAEKEREADVLRSLVTEDLYSKRKAALAAERERCASIAGRFANEAYAACGSSGNFITDKAEMAQALVATSIAAAIRAQGE